MSANFHSPEHQMAWTALDESLGLAYATPSGQPHQEQPGSTLPMVATRTHPTTTEQGAACNHSVQENEHQRTHYAPPALDPTTEHGASYYPRYPYPHQPLMHPNAFVHSHPQFNSPMHAQPSTHHYHCAQPSFAADPSINHQQASQRRQPYQPAPPQQPMFDSTQACNPLQQTVQRMQRDLQRLAIENHILQTRLASATRHPPPSSTASLPESSADSHLEDHPIPSEAPHPYPIMEDCDDDTISVASSSPHGAAPRLPRFDKADLKRLRTGLQPSVVARWCEEFIDTLEDYSTQAVMLARLPQAEAKRRISMDRNLAAIDRWAARQALNCLDREAPDVQLLMDGQEAHLRSAQKSITTLLPLLSQRSRAINGEEARLRAKHFDEAIYFKDGMDESATQLKANQLRADFLALPSERTSPPHALERALLEKMPSSISWQRHALEDKLIEAEATGVSLPWTYDQLAKITAQYLIAVARRATTPQREAHGMDAMQKMKCVCCGKAGHRSSGCRSKCKQCHDKNCPGNYGSTCILTKPSPIPDVLLNALGKPVPPHVRTELLKKHADKYSTSASSTARSPPSTKSTNAMHTSQSTTQSFFASSPFENELYAGGHTTNCMHASKLWPLQSVDAVKHSSTSLGSFTSSHEIGLPSTDDFTEYMHAFDKPPTSKTKAVTFSADVRDRAQEASAIQTDSGASETQTLSMHASPKRTMLDAQQTLEISRLATTCDSEPFLIMIDGGSNYNVFGHPKLPGLGSIFNAPPVDVTGWNASSTCIDSHYTVDLVLSTTTATTHTQAVVVGYSPSAHRHILSESIMWDTARWSAHKEPHMCITTPEGSIPMQRINGLYFIEACIRSPDASQRCNERTQHVNVASARRIGADTAARLWAARLHLTGNALRHLPESVKGMGFEKITPNMVRAADTDTIIKRSNMRRKPVDKTTAPEATPKQPGTLWILDAFGPVAAPSVVDGAHYELEAVCATTGFGYDMPAADVTQDTWLLFIQYMLAAERSLGHAPRTVRFDRAPNIDCASFKEKLVKQTGLQLQISSNHEGVGAAESRNDVKQRMAEADLQRSETSLSYLLPARKYAGWRHNRRIAQGATLTRFELHTARRPDFTDPVPYLFGVECAILEDESERGPKGAGCHPSSAHKGRTSLGRFLGIDGHAYVVRLYRGSLVRPRHITALNEHVLLSRGVPSGGESVDAFTQCSHDSLDRAPTISSSFPPPQPYDVLALPEDVGPPSTRTRAALARGTRAQLIEACLATVPLSRVQEFYDAALFQYCPELDDLCDSAVCGTLDAARARLSAEDGKQPMHASLHAVLEINKATADIIQVQTDAGIQEYRVPSTHKQRESAPDALAWRDADELALQVLLHTPSRDGRFNRLVPISLPRSLQQPVVPSVLQRRIKTDPVSRRLVKRKSRLCVAGDRQKVMQMQTGTYVPRQAHADAADDLLVKMLVADSAGSPLRPPKRRVKLDIGNAYTRGVRSRPSSYLSLGTSLARKDDAGEELCLELNTPTYGEEPAGDDWGETFHRDICKVGWQPAEAVPALYYHPLPGGEHALFCRVVDDVLITLPPGSDEVAARTIALFKAFYNDDVSVQWDPDSFLGYSILVESQSGAVTLNMASHVEHAVRQHLPDMLLDPTQRPSTQLRKGESLARLADSLKHSPATGPLTPAQKEVQRILGALRYPEKVMPVLTLGLHRLSCVAQNPPPDALRVAHLLLELAFDQRFEGLTFGGVEMAPLQCSLSFGIDPATRPGEALEAYGDATWTVGVPSDQRVPSLADFARRGGDGVEVAAADLYSVLLLFRGAAVFHQSKKLALLVDSSMGAEAIATSKVAEIVEYAAQIERAMGARRAGPVRVGTDNKSNAQVAMHQGAAARSKHLLRRYFALVQRVLDGEVAVCYVPDGANPADFLTKWVSTKKLRASLAFVTGSTARAPGFVKRAIAARRSSVTK